MAELFGGFGRKVLVSQAGSLSTVDSIDFGVVEVGRFARLTGIVIVDSVPNNDSNLQFQFQRTSGTVLTTSQLAITSGGLHFNVTNEANYVGLGITPVNSDTFFSAIIFGELVR